MADKTAIEWTAATWNPIRARHRATGKVGWHCETVSEGCRHCYAARMNADRLGTRLPYKPGHRDEIEMFLDEKMLTQPLRWRRGRKIFVCSMTDLFADFVPDEWIDRIFAVMALSPQHTFQVLTKRPERLRDYVSWPQRPYRIASTALMVGRHLPDGHPGWDRSQWTPSVIRDCSRTAHWPLPNVWMGTSVEDQPTADTRIPHLLATPAAVRFVSAEPLLGPVDFTKVGNLQTIRQVMPKSLAREERARPATGNGSISNAQIDAVGNRGSSILFFQTPDHMGGFTATSPREWPRLDWVIVGGESGPKARPMHPDWAISLRDQCDEAGVPFFFKQMAKRAVIPRDLVIREFPNA